MGTMKAVLIRGDNEYGVETTEIPSPGYNEVLVKIEAVAICGSDPRIFAGGSRNNGWPPHYPFIAGHEFAGVVYALGEGVTKFKEGDRVSGEAHNGCGTCEMCMKGYYNLCLNYRKEGSGHRHYGHYSPGCYAQYQVYGVKALTLLPDSVSFEEGTLVDTAGTALNSLRLTGVVPGGFTAIIGPGPMGMSAMLIAKALGSSTIIIGRNERLEFARKLGADYVIDFEKTNPVEEVRRITGGLGADQSIEAAGSKDAYIQAIHMSRKGGHAAYISIPIEDTGDVPIKTLIMNQITLHGVRANPNCSKTVIDLIERNFIDIKRLITHEYGIDDIKEAFDTFINRRDGALKVIVKPWK